MAGLHLMQHAREQITLHSLEGKEARWGALYDGWRVSTMTLFTKGESMNLSKLQE